MVDNFCFKCGSVLKLNAEFCSTCGIALIENTPTEEDPFKEIIEDGIEFAKVTEGFDFIKARLGVDEKVTKVTPTGALKTTEEMRSLLTSSNDAKADLANAQKALESERRRGANLNPAWYDYGIAKQEAIAADNFLRVLRTVDNVRHSQLLQYKSEFEKQMAAFSEGKTDEVIGQEAIRLMEEAVRRLSLPRLIIEYTLFPEQFDFGTKRN